MKLFFTTHADDIAGFIGGSGFSLCFAGPLFTSITHIVVVGVIGGICGVVGKEIGAWIVRSFKGLFK